MKKKKKKEMCKRLGKFLDGLERLENKRRMERSTLDMTEKRKKNRCKGKKEMEKKKGRRLEG